MGAPVVHYEITGKDGPALREFYGSLFGWDFDLQPAPRDYGLIAAATEGGMTGGVGTSADGPGAVIGLHVGRVASTTFLVAVAWKTCSR